MALDRGLQWLQRNQGPEGNWTSRHLGLVSMGLLAFLADGHAPGRGRYGAVEKKALDYVLHNAKPSGLLNIAGDHNDMYNHGLSTFVLGQAYGMTGDPRVGPALDRALKVIDQCQCQDGGWQYEARSREAGNDLSLAVMQAKALRSAVDSGFEVRPYVIERAIRDVREHYQPRGCPRDASEEEQQKHPGRFTYSKGGGQESLAMVAAGVVCLQEFAQYDDWRIPKNIEIIEKAVREMSQRESKRSSLRQCPPCLHHLLCRPGLVPGGRRTLEAVLSAASRPPDFQPDSREQSRERRRMAGIRRRRRQSGNALPDGRRLFRAGDTESLSADPPGGKDR